MNSSFYMQILYMPCFIVFSKGFLWSRHRISWWAHNPACDGDPPVWWLHSIMFNMVFESKCSGCALPFLFCLLMYCTVDSALRLQLSLQCLLYSERTLTYIPLNLVSIREIDQRNSARERAVQFCHGKNVVFILDSSNGNKANWSNSSNANKWLERWNVETLLDGCFERRM